MLAHENVRPCPVGRLMSNVLAPTWHDRASCSNRSWSRYRNDGLHDRPPLLRSGSKPSAPMPAGLVVRDLVDDPFRAAYTDLQPLGEPY